MYATFYWKVLLPFYETFLMRRGTLKYLKELERTQWLSEEEIRRNYRNSASTGIHS